MLIGFQMKLTQMRLNHIGVFGGCSHRLSVQFLTPSARAASYRSWVRVPSLFHPNTIKASKEMSFFLDKLLIRALWLYGKSPDPVPIWLSVFATGASGSVLWFLWPVAVSGLHLSWCVITANLPGTMTKKSKSDAVVHSAHRILKCINRSMLS